MDPVRFLDIGDTASTENSLLQGGGVMSRFVEGEPMMSKVAITSARTYEEAERDVTEAIELLGGPEAVCRSGDVVMIKPNMILPKHPDLAETTHPAVVAALVKVLKNTGATIKVGEQAAWHFDTEEAFEVTGIRRAAMEAGADEIVNWQQDTRVDVEVPDPRSIQVASLPESVTCYHTRHFLAPLFFAPPLLAAAPLVPAAPGAVAGAAGRVADELVSQTQLQTQLKSSSLHHVLAA